MKKTIFLSMAVALTIFSSCKKETRGEEPNPQNPSDTLLIGSSTGWKHVMSIDTKDKGLSGCDITSVGSEIAVLYKSTKNNQSDIHYHKVKFKEGDNQSPTTTMLGFSTSGRTIYYSQFIPESFTPVFTDVQYMGNHYALIDENNTRTVRFITELPGFINYYYTKSADYLGVVETLNGNRTAYAVQYGSSKFPPAPIADGFMSRITTAYILGSFVGKMTIPLKLSDNNAYTFAIGTDGAQVKYQVLKLLPDVAQSNPNYEEIDHGVFSGWQASGLESNDPYRSLVAFSYDNNELTFVLADYKMVSGVHVMNKLHCYRWKKGTAGLSTLWESPEVEITLSNALSGKETILDVQTRRYEENRLTPDGTLYTIHTKKLYTQPSPEKQYSVLYTVNASGIKELGRTDYLYNNYKQSVWINTCRYINGAYYALVYPISDYENVKNNSPKYHIEVVKLTP